MLRNPQTWYEDHKTIAAYDQLSQKLPRRRLEECAKKPGKTILTYNADDSTKRKVNWKAVIVGIGGGGGKQGLGYAYCKLPYGKIPHRLKSERRKYYKSRQELQALLNYLGIYLDLGVQDFSGEECRSVLSLILDQASNNMRMVLVLENSNNMRMVLRFTPNPRIQIFLLPLDLDPGPVDSIDLDLQIRGSVYTDLRIQIHGPTDPDRSGSRLYDGRIPRIRIDSDPMDPDRPTQKKTKKNINPNPNSESRANGSDSAVP